MQHNWFSTLNLKYLQEIEVLLGILAKKVDDGFASMNKRFDEFKEEQRVRMV